MRGISEETMRHWITTHVRMLRYHGRAVKSVLSRSDPTPTIDDFMVLLVISDLEESIFTYSELALFLAVESSGVMRKVSRLVRDDYIQACYKGSPRRAKTFAISGLGMTLVKSYKRQMKRLIATPDYDPILEGV